MIKNEERIGDVGDLASYLLKDAQGKCKKAEFVLDDFKVRRDWFFGKKLYNIKCTVSVYLTTDDGEKYCISTVQSGEWTDTGKMTLPFEIPFKAVSLIIDGDKSSLR